MSTTIDERVVSMQFDNKQFEENVQTSLGTIDKLQKSLKFKGATDGLEEVNSAAKGMDFSPLANAVESVGRKFNALEVMAVTALMNITNSAVNAGKRIVASLTIDPIKTGFSEYETQINAIQTILANTESKGTTLDQVNSALDELNTYADKTIYNFTQMTRNIGTFTAAGVDLDTSVSAIKGIANLAAVSGSNSQQASVAMYQLSQALASGTVKLMDWNSVVNAGMGGQVFQDALKETARVHGIAIDDIIEEQGSFRNSLSEGWLSSEILTETLAKFTGDLTEEQLKSMGYTKKQIDDIMKLGKTANDAATKVKTFTQLMDTLKEAAQSGWSQTWRILVGDFERAKELWSGVSDTLSAIIGASAEARNKMLQGWADGGGREMALESFKNIWKAILAIITPIKEAFREIFPKTTAEQLLKITKAIKDFTAKLKLNEKAQKKIKSAFKGFFSVLDIGITIVKSIITNVAKLFGNVVDLGGGVINVAGSLGDWITKIRDGVKESNIFGKALEKVTNTIQKLIDYLKEVGNKILGAFDLPGLSGLAGFFEGLYSVLSWIGEKIAYVVSVIVDTLSRAFRDGGLSAVINTAFDFINGGLVSLILYNLKEFASGLSSITGIFDSIADAIQYDAIMKISKAILILSIALIALSLIKPEVLSESLGAITILFTDLVGAARLLGSAGGIFASLSRSAQIGALVTLAQAILILAISLKLLSGIPMTDIAFALGAIMLGLTGLVIAVKKLPTENVNKAAKTIRSMSLSLVILALALKIMATMSWEEVGRSLTTMAAGLTALVLAVNLLPGEAKLFSSSKALSGLTVSLVVMAAALKIMATMSWDDIGRSLATMAGGLTLMIAAIRLLPPEAKLYSASAAFSRLSVAVVILAAALKIMSTMSWDDVGRSLVSLAGALTLVVTAIHFLPKDTALKVAGFISLTSALVIMAAALKVLSTISWDGLARSLVALAVSMGVLVLAVRNMTLALPGAAAVVVVASALLLLIPVLYGLAILSWGAIAKGLTTIALAFAIVIAAGWALKPIIAVITNFGYAIALIGVGMLAMGGGVLAIGAGLTALAGGIVAIMGAMGAIVTIIIEMIKAIFVGIAEGIVGFIKTIYDAFPLLMETFVVIIKALCDALIELVPEIANTILELIVQVLESLVDFLPSIVASIIELIIGVINEIANHIPDILTAIGNLIGKIFEGIIEALKKIDPNILVNALLSVGVLSALILALTAIKPLIPPAMAALLELGLFVAELGLVIAAFGALASLPGMMWLIEQGGHFLQAVGTAIGQFIGGIIGGVALGATSTLPAMADNLSRFMSNLQPFLTGMASVDSKTLDSVRSLATSILVLTAANVLDSLTSWITGSSSISKFAEEIVPFGEAMAKFSSAVTGRIDEGAVTAAANAGRIMSDMASTLPKSGGVVGFFTGESDWASFTAQLVPFGQAMTKFSSIVANKIDEGAVVAAANAGKAMSEMAETLPNSGGVVGFFTGENDLETFNKQIVPFATAMAAFSHTMSGNFDEGAVTAAANAGKALAEMNAAIPETGGLKAFFSGEKDMTNFTNQLVPFGEAMARFSSAVAGKIDAEAVTSVANAGKTISEMSNINVVGLSSAIENLNRLVELAKGMEDVSFVGLSEFGESIGKLAVGGINDFIQAFSDAEERASAAGKKLVDHVTVGMTEAKGAITDAVEALIAVAKTGLSNGYDDFYDAGSSLVDGFAAGISENDYKAAAKAKAMAEAAEKAAKKALDINSPSKVFRSIGSSVPEGFAMGIDMLGNEVKKSTVSMTDKSIDGVKRGISRIADVVNSDIDTQPTIRPVLDLSDVESGAHSINDMLSAGVPVSLLNNVGRINTLMTQRNQNGTIASVVSEIDKLNKNIEGMEHATYNINGVSFTEGSDVEEAFRTILRAAKIERRA